MTCPDCGRRMWYGHPARCRTPGTDAFAPGRHEADVKWFERTGHCGGCGQPAAVCVCSDALPCGCRHLHEMGVGVGVDVAAVFAESAPVEVGDEQGELFA